MADLNCPGEDLLITENIGSACWPYRSTKHKIGQKVFYEGKAVIHFPSLENYDGIVPSLWGRIYEMLGFLCIHLL